MRKVLLERFAKGLSRNLAVTSLVLVVLVVLSVWGASKLKINSNQLDLLPQKLRAVKEAKRLSEMTGGIGFLMLALKGPDEKHLKAVAEDLAPQLRAMSDVRFVRYKIDTEFVRNHILYYVDTRDLKLAYRQINNKVKDVVRRANPFFIELRKTKPVKLDLDNLVAKYKRLGMKGISDNYYITPDKGMLLMLIKPKGELSDLEFTRALVNKVDALLAQYSQSNKTGATLREGYGALVPKATVTYGYTGGYKLSLDDSDSILQSLIPTSTVALGGIFILLLIFLRRLSLVISLVISLVVGIAFTFGYSYLVVGELNSITAILGGILMGQGIDFGIHFIYRLKEEYTAENDLQLAIRRAISHSGAAAATTAATTAAAFFVWAPSDFKGFSDFGLIAGGGTIIIAICMYFVTATILLLMHRALPRFMHGVLLQREGARETRIQTEKDQGGLPGARPIVLLGLLITVGLITIAIFPDQFKSVLPEKMTKGISFDYDSRSLLVKNRPSLVLQEEIKQRFKISANPAGIYTATLSEAEALYRSLKPIDPIKYSMVDEVISLFTFLPAQAQQIANQKILAQLKKDFEPIKASMLDPKHRPHFDKLLKLLDAKPFTLAGLPEHYRKQFVNVPDSKTKGYLTFVYPKVSLWDSRDLLAFSNQVSEIKVGDKVYHTTGVAILFARLATIVLHDGKQFTLLAALLIFLVILVDLRRIGQAMIALMPLAMGVGWMLGVMALVDQPINFMNVIVFPVVLGYGVGSGLYIFHRFRECGSVKTALNQTGRAVVASCTTTLVGWLALLTANHRGLESMGIVAGIGIACVLVTSLTVLPASIQLFKNWSDRRSTT